MRWLIMLGLFLCVCGLVGCMEGMPSPQTQERTESYAKQSARPAAGGEVAAQEPVVLKDADGIDENQALALEARGAKKGQGNKEPAGQAVEPVKRKIIFTGSADVSVEDYDKAVRELKALVKNLNGFISNTDNSGTSGGQRAGTYTVRVPVDNFDTFMEDIEKIGELRHSKTNSQDVTDQYIDVEAQMKTDKVIEEGLHKLHDKIAEKGVSEELFRVEERLRTIRAQILASERRLQRWDKDAAMSTVVVKLEQRKEYAPAGAPDFGTTVSRTWEGSVNALAAFGRGFVLFAVAVAPWVPLFAVVTSPLWFLLWRQWRKARPARPAAPAPAAPLPAVVEPA
jgi:hypothetical protein